MADAATDTTTATAADTTAQTTTTQAPSLIDTASTTATTTTAAQPIPEKYQVKRDDGTVDEAASLAKFAEGHAALEKRLGSGGLPPAAPDAYEPEGLPEGFNFDEVKADPLYQEFAKEAHLAGLNNAQMGLVLKAWHERGAELVGEGVGLTLEQAKAELVTAWGDEAAFGKNIAAASGAIGVIASKAGLSIEQVNEAGLGRNPVFLRLMASIADEFKPDGSTPNGEGVGAQDFDTQLAEIRAHPAYADPKHPEHAALMARKDALYAKRYPPKKS